MKEYLICSLFWILFVVLLYYLGNAINGGKKSVAHNLITGYMVYSSLIAIAGIVMQLANVPWNLFALYVGVLWCFVLGFSLYKSKKDSISFSPVGIKEYIADNWYLYIVSIILVVILAFYYAGFWLGNHLDDGYYITKVATLPYSEIGNNINYAVGIENTGFNSYIVNTWELEASVYVKVLGVSPTLFLRLFQSAFYYYLFVNLIQTFGEILVEKGILRLKKATIQYGSTIVILLSAYYLYLSNSGMLKLRDMFHLNTGMFLGASVVKLFGVFLFANIYMEYRNKKSLFMIVLSVICVSIVLISKSAISLPVIAIVGSAVLIVWLVFDMEKKGRIIGTIYAILYILIAIVIPNHTAIEETVRGDVLNTVQSYIIVPCLIIFLCSFLLKNELIIRINVITIVSLGFMLLPEINDLFETFSVYGFVAGRAWTAIVYFLIILNTFYLIILLHKIITRENVISILFILSGIVFTVASIWGFRSYGGEILPTNPSKKADLKQCLSVMKNNIYFTPNSTINLGQELENLAEKTQEQLCVVMPKLVSVDGTLHSLAVSIRSFAPDIISASAAERFPVNNGSNLEGYKQETYDAFVANPDDEKAKLFEAEINHIGANCVVLQNSGYDEWMKDMGYCYYSSTSDNSYEIWYKEQ